MQGCSLHPALDTCRKSPLTPPFDLAQGMLFQRGGFVLVGQIPPLAKGSCEKIVSLFGLITRIKFLRVTIFSF